MKTGRWRDELAKAHELTMLVGKETERFEVTL